MSFSDLKAQRQSKQSKSFVNANAKAIKASQESASSHPIVKNGGVHVKAVSDETGLYTALPSYLEVRRLPERGRGIYIKDIIKRGAILFATKPHVHVLSTRNLEHFCSTCVTPAPETGLKRCTRCRVIFYCNSACQNGDWPLHKQECAAIQRWAAGAPSPDVAIPAEPIRCLGRVLWKKQKEGKNSVWAREIDAIQSNRTSLDPSVAEAHTHFAHSVIRYLGLTAPEELGAYGISSAAEIVDLMSRFTTNSITLTAPSLTPIGVTVSPPVALINHSCDPNAVVVFPRASRVSPAQEPSMHVVAIRDILKGEEVYTAYIDTTVPRTLRQHALQTQYSFTCHCNLCTATDAEDLRESMLCPKNCGGTCPLPTEEDPLVRCRKCKAAVSKTDEVLDALRIGQEALDKATSLQFSNLPKALQLTTKILPILSSVNLHPSSYPYLALTRLHQSLLLASFPPTITQDALDTVIRATSASVTGLSALLTPGHPIRALALAELGKLLAVDEPAPNPTVTTFPPSGPQRLQLAYETLVRAREELCVGFGEKNDGGEVGREVREMVVRVERELSAWKQGVRNVIEDTPGLKGGARKKR